MSRIPLEVRVGLRDLWENPEAAAPKAIKTLKDLLGYDVNFEIDTSKLWFDLQRYYPDPEVFAPNIIGIIQIWANCLTIRLEDDNNASWADRLLDVVSERSNVVRVCVEPSATSHVKTVWSQKSAKFLISIPEMNPPYGDDPRSTITSDLQNLFERAPGASESDRVPVAMNNDQALGNLPFRNQVVSSSTRAALPSLQSLARPELLFLSKVPYQMALSVIHNGIVVQGSHQPSLQLLKEYFEKYARVDRNDAYKTPTLKVELQQSLFGYGSFFDSVQMTPRNPRGSWESVNPILVISFIESVLGYQMIPGMSGNGHWQFKRETSLP